MKRVEKRCFRIIVSMGGLVTPLVPVSMDVKGGGTKVGVSSYGGRWVGGRAVMGTKRGCKVLRGREEREVEMEKGEGGV